jgi:flagellar biosynthesis/type III secretory pathway chaperone
LINELKTVVGAGITESSRSVGGLDEVLRDLEQLDTLEGITAEELAELKRKVSGAQADFQNDVKLLKDQVDDLTLGLTAANEAVDKKEKEFEAAMKLLRESKDKVDLELLAVLKREIDLKAKKLIDDTEIQRLKDAESALGVQLAASAQELADSKAREAADADEIKKLTDKIAALDAEIVRLTQELADTNLKQVGLLASDVSRQAELLELARIKAELAAALANAAQLELDKQQLEVDKLALGTRLTSSGVDFTAEHLERTKLYEEMRIQRETITQYERELKEIIEKIKKATLDHEKIRTGLMWQIHEKVDHSIRGEFTASALLELLKAGSYGEFKAAVMKKTGVVTKDFNAAALFLTYESIGGTWQMFEEKTNKLETSELMAQKLMHDILLFQTIKTHDTHMVNTYNTKHFRAFLDVFGCWKVDASGAKVEVIAFPG